MRRWICRLQLLLLLAGAFILRSQFRWTRDHILLSQIPPGLEGQVLVFIFPRNRVARLYTRLWVPIPLPLTTRRATVEVFDLAYTQDSLRWRF
jgi:hypothetical protein